jgi:glutamate N-acetyltransferase/amino-acid N-acetyltransferase
MALGKTFDQRLDPETVQISFGEHIVYEKGAPTGIEDEPVENYMKATDEVTIAIKLGLGEAESTVWGCDLTEDYIKINALYRT